MGALPSEPVQSLLFSASRIAHFGRTKKPSTHVFMGRTPLTGGRKSGGVGKRAHRSVICDYENNRADGCVPGILPEPGLYGKREKRRGQYYQSWEETRAVSVQDLRQDVQRAGRHDVRR